MMSNQREKEDTDVIDLLINDYLQFRIGCSVSLGRLFSAVGG